MPHPTVSNQEMLARIVRFAQVKERPIPLMFIDSILPGHQRMNYAIIGDTASENPDFAPAVTTPHKFQIGMFCAPPGNGPAYHTHDYVEMFLILSGKWRFYWGNDAEGEPEGEATLGKWDMISLPPGLYRGFEVTSKRPAWGFAVLDPHAVFAGKDPIWSPKVVRAAEQHNFHADARGKMIKPANYADLHAEMLAKLQAAVADAEE
ncbi:MAG: cupin domain-containing protein [Chloroflexota bacterium]|nr:cupin domain-containing protein [Chloroflexota bacterium]